MSILKFSVHPGRILQEEFIEPMGLSPIKLARHIRVPRTRLERLVREETSMTLNTAALLAAAFQTSVAFWMNLQTNYDVSTTEPAKDIEPIAAAG